MLLGMTNDNGQALADVHVVLVRLKPGPLPPQLAISSWCEEDADVRISAEGGGLAQSLCGWTAT